MKRRKLSVMAVRVGFLLACGLLAITGWRIGSLNALCCA